MGFDQRVRPIGAVGCKKGGLVLETGLKGDRNIESNKCGSRIESVWFELQ